MQGPGLDQAGQGVVDGAVTVGVVLAPDVVTLNLARVVMGIGSGLLNPQVTGMIQQYYSREALRDRKSVV